MKNNEEFYKVVLKNPDKRLTSIWAYGDAQVTYILGEWTESPGWLADEGYGLCVFDSKLPIQFWTTAFCHAAKVEVEEEMPLPKMAKLSALSTGEIDTERPTFGSTWPPGTRMFRRVKLVEFIS